LEAACPRLRDRGHGSWYFHCSVPTMLGTERIRRGGFPSRLAAAAARDELWAQSAEDVTAEIWTVGRWLRWWLGTRVSLRPSTLRSYTEHVERVCCVQRDRAGVGSGGSRWSHGQCEFGQCCGQAEPRWDVGGEFVVAAADVLHERMSGGDPGGLADLFQPAHWR
jgi:hypothetical protein